MAKGTEGNTSAVESNTQAANLLGQQITGLSDSVDTLNNAISELGQGLKLTAKGEDKDKKNEPEERKEDPTQKDLSKIIELLKDSGSLIGQVIENQNTISAAESEENPGGIVDLGEDEEEDPFEEFLKTPVDKIELDATGSEVSNLAKAANFPSLLATGFGVMSNKLSGILKEISKSLSDNNGAGNPAGGAAPVTASEVIKEDKKDEDSAAPGKTFTKYLSELAGPLESIASGVVMLAIAVGILSLIQPTAAAIATVTFMVVLMTALIGGLVLIEGLYKSLAPESLKTKDGKPNDGDGTLLGMVKAFSDLFMKMAITFIIMSIFSDIIWDGFGKAIGLLSAVIGITVVTFFALEAGSALVNELIGKGGENSSMLQLVKAFTNLLFTIVILSVICYFFEPIILGGLGVASLIMLEVMAMMSVMSLVMGQTLKKVKPEAIEQFSNLMRNIVIMIAVVGILVVILGIMPAEMVMQGIMAVGLIMTMITTMVFMLTKTLKGLDKISEKKLKELTALLIVITVMIALTSIVVIILAQQDPAALMVAMVCMAGILTLPVLAIKILSKINVSSIPKAILTVVMASLLVVAIAGAIWVISLILGPAIENFGGPENMLMALVAVTLMTAVIAGVALAGVVLGAMIQTVPMMLMGIATIAIATLLVIAISAAMLAVSAILKPAIKNFGGAETMLIAIVALGLMVSIIVATAVAGLVLAALFIPLFFCMSLAKRTVWMTIGLIGTIILGMTVLAVVVQNASSVDMEGFNTFLECLMGFTMILVTLIPPLVVFVSVGSLLVVLLAATAVEILLMTVSVMLITWGVNKMGAAAANAIIPDLTPMVAAIDSLNEMSKVINKFKSPSLFKMFGVMSAVTFAEKFARRLGKIATIENADKIAKIADSLSKLADSRDGLKLVASALRDIQEATDSLNVSKLSALEKLNGPGTSAEVKANSIKDAVMALTIKNKGEKKDSNNDLKELMRDMLNELRGMKEAMTALASQSISDSISIKEGGGSGSSYAGL